MKIKTGSILNKRYKIVELIGRGGMAEVYKVYDEEKFTHFALKVLHEHLSTDRVFLRRFQREAQTLIQLQHPNIVRLYGLEQEGARAFMVMDYIDGRSLRRAIFDKKRGFTPREALRILAPACAALQFAHAKGYIHCDLKPDNILVSASDQVFLSDFGIARMMDAATSTMVGAGTPAYMAPELVRGQDPTAQTDIYALGVILYEMLSGGERPFTGEHARTSGSTSIKVCWEHINLPAPALRVHNSNISPKVEAVMMRCLQKDPKGRYSSPRGLLRAFEAAAGGKTIPKDEVPVKPSRPTSKNAGAREQAAPRKKNPIAAIVIGAGVFLAFCIAVIAGLSSQEKAVQEQAATASRQEPTATAALTQPKIAGADHALAAYEAGVETQARTTLMSASKPILFSYGWYAIDQTTLEDNLSDMIYAIFINDERVSDDLIAYQDYRTEDGYPGREFFILIEDWPPGEHEIKLEENFLTDINDGLFDFESGSEFILYTIKVSGGSSGTDPTYWPLMYSENFSVDTDEWMLIGPNLEDKYTSTAEFRNGKYEVNVTSNGDDVIEFLSPYINLLGDYHISFDAALVSGDIENACYGLIFGYEYWWELCEDQYFQIFKYVEEEVSIIEEWKYSSSISSTSDNHLSVDVTGNQVQLFINDTLVSSFNATAPTDGFLDLFVNTYEASSGTFTFDSLEIRMP